MDVIPLTLLISLILSLTFIALFVREFSRPRRAGADRDSLLPLEPEQPITVVYAGECHSAGHGLDDDTCISQRTDGKRCASCRRREARAAAKAAASGDASATS